MTDLLFEAPALPTLPVAGQSARYPVRRIFCVGRNYAEHAKEMGAEVDRESPVYFTKSAFALAASGSALPYPPGTEDLHHEVELTVALGAPLFRASEAEAAAAVFGYAVGLDMTRRDLQAAAKAKRHPWDTGKDFEGSAIIAGITPAATFGAVADQPIALTVNGAPRQGSGLGEMIWSVPALLAHLSTLYHLGPGDLVMTGTPSGVGAVGPGDVLEGTIAGLAPVRLTITAPE